MTAQLSRTRSELPAHRDRGRRPLMRVRRAKLYYLRQLTGKATRIKEKKVRVVVPTTGTAEE